MLQIFCAREDVSKEQFIYENIEGETLVIVPDQYTLVGEEQALKYMKTACLLDVEILSMNRLGLRVLTEQGLENVPVLDKYERYMLLSKVVREQRDNLEMFKVAAGKRTFVEMINDFISDFKQQECTSDELKALIDDESTDPLLRKKLEEIRLLVDAYEEALAGRFADNEDYISMYTEAIANSKQFMNKNIWVYGFDTLTPKFTGAIMSLARVSRGVSIMVNQSDFGMDRVTVKLLEEEAVAQGIPHAKRTITPSTNPEYVLEKSETVKRIEKSLFATGRGMAGENASFDPVDLRVVECANTYYEAENAAAYVYELLRDYGYSMSDIVIICNDSAQMQKIVKRVFDEYDLPLFVDSNRGIGDSQVIAFVVSILEAARYDYRTSAILTALKSGLTGVPSEDVDELENYVKMFQIRGRMWTKPFTYKADAYDDEALARINGVRELIAVKIAKLRDAADSAVTVNDFAEAFYLYLQDEWSLKATVEQIKDEQYDSHMFEESQRTAQSYNEAIRVLDRVRDILGDMDMEFGEFLELYTEGVLTAEVGIIPPTVDGISMGTMIRTRPAPPKAVLVLGANEGVLPMEPDPEGLFSVDEKAFFTSHDFPLGQLDDVKMQEENVAMYRIMSKASERVYISYSMSDGIGSDMKPSVLVDSIRTLFPRVTVHRDIVSQGYGMPLVASGEPALRHMINYFKEKPEETALSKAVAGEVSSSEIISDAVMKWYEANEPEVLERVLEAGCDENNVKNLSLEMSRRLFTRTDGKFSFSASRIEQYNHCPFKHYVQHGLRAENNREFKGGAAEIGEMYHDCMMQVSKALKEEGILSYVPGDGDGAGSPFDRDAIAEKVHEALQKYAAEYKDGLFHSSAREEYRLSRIEEVCIEAMCVLAMQFRLGQIENSFFEEEFGRRGCKFQPITYSLHGEKVYIEGKIDRVDIMKGDRIRIVDYKTGRDKLDIDKMRTGYKMQLMVYLQGAEEQKRKPAGMFYINIADDLLKLDGTSEAKQDALLKKASDSRFTLNGAYVNDEANVEAMPMSVLHSDSFGKTPEEFSELEEECRKTIELMADGIVTGDIRIEPAKLKSGDRHAECRYCDFKAICRFDLSYKHNNFRMV